MQDHRAFLVNKFSESQDVCRMDWPSRSPDLNHIVCLGWSGKSNCKSQSLSEIHSMLENSADERVGQTATGTQALLFQAALFQV